ncbi:MAG TPA: DUF3618 domain-containing protein [Solirubrobacterales bacterium]|nr:DUF3618 domain-containing protein [Solirubrobacterales bacterium]
MSDTPTPTSRPGAPGRSADQIRNDIAAQQSQLAGSVDALRGRVNELTDWRRQVREHRTEIVATAAVAGFVVGGLVALSRRRRRRR